MYPILESTTLVPNLHLVTLSAPEIARSVQPGQFVILRAEENGERIPLTVSDWDPEKCAITLVYLTVGRTTQKLAALTTGDMLPTVVGPLGNAMEIDHFGSVLCIGGCYGIASIYPTARALKEKGNRVTILIEARSSYLLYWQEKLKKVSDRLITITRDGSQGLPGHIDQLPAVLAGLPAPVDRIIINGCNYLMMRGAEATRPAGIKTIVSLNTLMIDGTGMCGVCRLTVNSSTKFACVDGPHFDAHEVDWAELAQRRQAYRLEEDQSIRSSAPAIRS
ncbi:MAG: sulfide/dihydroorotate dehydrogenase-like FAD/NAD-binding protein [Chloroflexi bacterium]|nr:MAG: sulfide/dihydroorotate dehydrogenase-like FAD/NAD-binding protein [Chloroflexota bacterium]